MSGLFLFTLPQINDSFPLAFCSDQCQYVDMVCPYCGTGTEVVNSRKQRRTNSIWRRRKCTACAAVFTSTEGADLQTALRVGKADGTLEPFSRDRLFISIYESCKHRETAATDASSVTQLVINRLLAAQEEPGLLPRPIIISTTIAALSPFDSAAATAYGAYHHA